MELRQLNKILSEVLSEKEIKLQQQGGGCINQCFKVETGNQKYFCKINSASKFPQLFEAEAQGLELIRNSKIFKTPEVIEIFSHEDHQFLLLEWIEEGKKLTRFWESFGTALAKLHNVTNEYYGLVNDNYMGSVSQLNKQNYDWITFFVEYRLNPLIKSCKEKNLLSSEHEHSFQNLILKLPGYFKNVKPSLVHGDLWSGNFMCSENEEPVLIDPAVYFGIPAVDIGMTKLFGGFNKTFYDAYQYHSALPPDDQQNKICNLYPLLIHLFLFGKSYLRQIEETINEFK
jgi:protein-ribulosamine 3-kinase